MFILFNIVYLKKSTYGFISDLKFFFIEKNVTQAIHNNKTLLKFSSMLIFKLVIIMRLKGFMKKEWECYIKVLNRDISDWFILKHCNLNQNSIIHFVHIKINLSRIPSNCLFFPHFLRVLSTIWEEIGREGGKECANVYIQYFLFSTLSTFQGKVVVYGLFQ